MTAEIDLTRQSFELPLIDKYVDVNETGIELPERYPQTGVTEFDSLDYATKLKWHLSAVMSELVFVNGKIGMLVKVGKSQKKKRHLLIKNDQEKTKYNSGYKTLCQYHNDRIGVYDVRHVIFSKYNYCSSCMKYKQKLTGGHIAAKKMGDIDI